MSQIVLKTPEEVRILFVRAVAERGWRNGHLSSLANCLLKWPSAGRPWEGVIGDYFDKTWLKKLEEKEGVVLHQSLFSKD